MLQLIKIATLSAALSAYGSARPEPATGTKAFYDRLPQAGARDEAGLLRIVAASNPRA